MKILKKFLMLFVLLMILDVSATSGTIRQNSVIKCNGKYYGNHGDPLHWHVVEKKNGKWASVSSQSVNEPSCYKDIPNEKETVTFSKCVDGDTARVVVDGEIKTVRFLAIDTPESVHPSKDVELYGKDASEYTCNLLTNAKKIELEYDKNSDKEDKYGRLLAYVYVDGEMVQKKLLEIGYAEVAYLYADYTHTEDLQKVEALAKSKKLGIWAVENVGDVVETNNDSSNENETRKTLIKIILDFLSQIFDKFLKYLESVL